MTEREGATSVILVDDHPIVLSGLGALIASDARYTTLATYTDGSSALNGIRAMQPDIAVLDLSMKGLTGLELLARIRADGLPTRAILLTASASDKDIAAAVEEGAWGILLKEAAADSLLECLNRVAEGERWLPPKIVNPALERTAEAGRTLESLTSRERELVQLAAEGLSNKEIARKVGVAEGTVKLHLHNVYQKLGVTNRTAMTALALKSRDFLDK